MRRRIPIFGVSLILIGLTGLFWFSRVPGPPGGPGGFPPGPGVGPGAMHGWWSRWAQKQAFASRGEQIYFIGGSQTGYIPRVGGPPWAQGGGCVACHGVTGRGGVPVMMGTAIPPDIQYAVLTGKQPGENMDHPPYTDTLIKRAIAQGLDESGKPLDWTMPRWQMSEEDQNDLLAYLKALK